MNKYEKIFYKCLGFQTHKKYNLPLFFYHVPKCAGTTFVVLISHLFKKTHRLSGPLFKNNDKADLTAYENYLNNELSFDEYTPDNVVMFKTIQPILDEIELVYGQERALFSNHLRTAGRVDCIGKFRGKNHIIDFKTSSKPKKEEWIDNYFMQCSAYSVMWEEMSGIPIPYIAIIIAVADEVPQVFIEHRDNWIDKFIELRNNYDNT